MAGLQQAEENRAGDPHECLFFAEDRMLDAVVSPKSRKNRTWLYLCVMDLMVDLTVTPVLAI